MAFSTHDIVSDSPTNNFATLNPLFRNSTLISDGNLKFNKSTIGWATSLANLNLNDGGKYYFEGMATLVGGSNSGIFIGLSKQSATQDNYQQSGIWSFGGTGSTLKIYDETTLVTPSGSSAANDIFKVCFDSSSGYLWFGKNADWYNSSGGTTGDPSNNTNPTITISSSDALFPIVIAYANAIIFNFGQDPTFGGAKSPSTTYTDANGIGSFYYQPPTGAKALCTANLPDFTPDVDDDTPQDYFKAVTYTGTGGGQVDPVLVGFQPDLVWIKNRDVALSHNIYDSVRTTADGPLLTDDTAVADGIERITFSSTGFNRSSTVYSYTNSSNTEYIAWSWKAGGAPTADNSNTSGAMTANSVSLNGTLQSNYTPAGSPTIYPKRMSINTDAGFSIVQWVGNQQANATIPHGLNTVPRLIILKCTEVNGMHWAVYHPDVGGVNNGHLNSIILNGTGTASASSIYWSNTAPTSSVFTTGTDAVTGYTGKKFIGYIWSEVEGYSKFGSYVGNGSTDGPFVYCGFRPAVIISKNIDIAANWEIYDSTRNSYNPLGYRIFPNSGLGETDQSSPEPFDFLSNGFKIRTTASGKNANTIIYMAFAEQPFNYANAR